ncbi:MAG: DegV family EDD domain-containing protein [candidate division Zixibacteria bacterium]|nr:DegV family EDD domain-containing protein [candidate division Zixibacteria bacterium]
MALTYCDGKRLRNVLLACSNWLSTKTEDLNAINVFPVADGDTGTNMAVTLRTTASAVENMDRVDLSDVADTMASSSLLGARGNSGVILSQYLRGFAAALKGRKKVYADDLAIAFQEGTRSAYEAIESPREGTILTIFRETGEHFKKWTGKTNDLLELMESSLEKAKNSLAETKYKLESLMDANVVDAGGQGFVHMLEAVVGYIKNGTIPKSESPESQSTEVPMHHARPDKRFCCEFMLVSDNDKANIIKAKLREMGNSLIVAASETCNNDYLHKVHIHADEYRAIESTIGEFGNITHRKVDDMLKQHRSITMIKPGRSSSVSTKTVRIVTDSTADLPPAVVDEYDISVVPLKVLFGTEEYADGVDLTPDSFLEKLSTNNTFPKTSQPASEEFRQQYETLLESGSTEDVVSIHLSSKLSGTFNSALQGRKNLSSPDRVSVFDSKTASLGMGMMVVEAARLAREGRGKKEILNRLTEIQNRSSIYFTIDTFEFLIKGGRVGKARGFIGELLNVKPILKVVDGEIVPVDKVRGKEKLVDTVIALLKKDIEDYKKVRFAVGMSNADINDLVDGLHAEFAVKPELIFDLGPVIASHTGPGAWGVYYQNEK